MRLGSGGREEPAVFVSFSGLELLLQLSLQLPSEHNWEPKLQRLLSQWGF